MDRENGMEGTGNGNFIQKFLGRTEKRQEILSEYRNSPSRESNTRLPITKQ